MGNRGHGKRKCNVTNIIFANIRTPKSTYYLLYDKAHFKTILASLTKKEGK